MKCTPEGEDKARKIVLESIVWFFVGLCLFFVGFLIYIEPLILVPLAVIVPLWLIMCWLTGVINFCKEGEDE